MLDAQSSAGTVDDWMARRTTTFALKIIKGQFSGYYLFNFSVLENLLNENKLIKCYNHTWLLVPVYKSEHLASTRCNGL